MNHSTSGWVRGETENMADRWHEPEFTAHWDRAIADANPSRALQVNMLVAMVSGLYQSGKWIVDLGFGSGRVEEQIFQQRGDMRIVGIDSSAAMINLARDRLRPWSNQYQAIQHDLTQLASVMVPAGSYQIAVSVQVLHHLPQAAQRALYAWVYATIEKGGYFLIVDKRSFEDAELDACRAAWNALEQNPAWRTGRNFDEHQQHEHAKGHSPATLAKQLEWLSAAGFAANCLQVHLDRFMIVARKP
ncbi:MAG: class I SAM-dependent methyltransferase [Acidobacteria bacterium]|nr:class I SAM-dependent methyltransferase [Acidobacteriota bacterium]